MDLYGAEYPKECTAKDDPSVYVRCCADSHSSTESQAEAVASASEDQVSRKQAELDQVNTKLQAINEKLTTAQDYEQKLVEQVEALEAKYTKGKSDLKQAETASAEAAMADEGDNAADAAIKKA